MTMCLTLLKSCLSAHDDRLHSRRRNRRYYEPHETRRAMETCYRFGYAKRYFSMVNVNLILVFVAGRASEDARSHYRYWIYASFRDRFHLIGGE